MGLNLLSHPTYLYSKSKRGEDQTARMDTVCDLCWVGAQSYNYREYLHFRNIYTKPSVGMLLSYKVLKLPYPKLEKTPQHLPDNDDSDDDNDHDYTTTTTMMMMTMTMTMTAMTTTTMTAMTTTTMTMTRARTTTTTTTPTLTSTQHRHQHRQRRQGLPNSAW